MKDPMIAITAIKDGDVVLSEHFRATECAIGRRIESFQDQKEADRIICVFGDGNVVNVKLPASIEKIKVVAKSIMGQI